ncbi:MAG: hypothetical protein K5660_08420 [Paludibacteraceae bacterium]|nr:hypothetical protein [Paludibacteraceae bacterium]
MSSLRNTFIFPLASWRGATFAQKRMLEGDVQVVFKRMRLSGYKFVQKTIVKSYDERSVATTNQSAARTKFATAWSNVRTVLSDPTTCATAEAEYKAQYGKKGKYYPTLRGYVFAREYALLP